MTELATFFVFRARRAATSFFRHWYLDGTSAILSATLRAVSGLERSVAVRVTLRHFSEPLYQDWSVVGRFLGVLFRSLRILFGTTLYLLLGVFSVALILVWALLPPFILYRIITTYGT